MISIVPFYERKIVNQEERICLVLFLYYGHKIFIMFLIDCDKKFMSFSIVYVMRKKNCRKQI